MGTSRPHCILVADDEAALRKLLSKVLRDHGYFVLEAGNGADALRHATECHGGIDLLLTDIVMPDMDGVELAAAVQDRYPAVPVLYMTGYSVSGLDPGCHCLEKPFSIPALLEAVRHVLQPVARTPRV